MRRKYRPTHHCQQSSSSLSLYSRSSISNNSLSQSKSHSHSNSLDRYFKKVSPYLTYPNDTKWTSSNNNGLEPSILPTDLNILYPKNPQIRKYQLSIVKTCLFHNTLVCLPTGLGKTHIASVVILNYYLTFKDSKIYFLAPTRPLVNQQRNSLAGFYQYINPEHIIELNGSLGSKNRVAHYKNKRVFFLTPQTLDNDLEEDRCDVKSTSLIIFDEAHRATGGYAYVNIVKNLDKQNIGYRIIGLSATPGNTLQQVQQVIQNLHINRMEVKDETDSDVKPYIHDKDIEAVEIKTTQSIRVAEKILDNFMKKPVGIIVSQQVVEGYIVNLLKIRGLNQGTYFQMMKSFKDRQEEHKQRIGSKNIGLVYASLRILKYLVDGKKTLKQQGYQTFNTFLKKFKEKKDERTGSSIPFLKQIIQSPQFKQLQNLFRDDSSNHPKLKKLTEILTTYFSSKEAQSLQSKAIIFTHHRTSAMEIQRSLLEIPVIKPYIFVGQSKTYQITTNYVTNQDSISSIQMKQKEQIEVIRKFKDNQLNTLVSTSIGEEGLDIGEVDLIVCYDNGMSPIRMVQRMGRTGRKRNGKVILLLMEGKEIQSYYSALSKNKHLKEIIRSNATTTGGVGRGGKVKFEFFSFNSSMFVEKKEYEIEYINNEKVEIVEIEGEEGEDSLAIQKRGSSKEKTKLKKKLPLSRHKKKTTKQLKQEQKAKQMSQLNQRIEEIKAKYKRKDNVQIIIEQNEQYLKSEDKAKQQKKKEEQKEKIKQQQESEELNYEQIDYSLLMQHYDKQESTKITEADTNDVQDGQIETSASSSSQQYTDDIVDRIIELTQKEYQGN